MPQEASSLRVAQLSPSFLPIIGGTELCVNNYAIHLTKQGTRSEIITLCNTKKWEGSTRLQLNTMHGMRVIVWPSYPIGQLRLVLTRVLNVHFFPAYPVRLATYLNRFDVLHLHDDVDLTFPLFCLRVNKPRILSCHTLDLNFELYQQNRVARRLLKKSANLFHVFSRTGAQQLRKLGVEGDKIRIVPHGVDVDKFKPVKGSLRHRTVRVILVGRITRIKAIENLLEAVQMMKQNHSINKRLEVLIVGAVWDIAYYNQLVQYTNQLQMKEVKFLGPVHPGALPELLQHAQIFVCSSLRETFGLANLEAMSSGLAIVGSSVGALPELIVDNQTGFLVPPGDPNALAQKLSILVNDDRLRESMGRKGRTRAVSLFSISRIAQNMATIYQELATQDVKS
jgi:glycosyltransferase involved in cell wall biosynthesis